MAWSLPLNKGSVQEGTPLVHDGKLYMPHPGDVITAHDAATGNEILVSDQEIISVQTTPGQILILDRPDVPHESIAMGNIEAPSSGDQESPIQFMGCQGVVTLGHD